MITRSATLRTLPPSDSLHPSLEYLPIEILQNIAELTNKRTIWSLMGTCRALREASEPALKRFLDRAKVVGQPAFIVDIFEEIDLKFAARNNARGLALVRSCKRFTKHLVAYPAAATLLRSLTIELEDYRSAPGWALVQEFAPQLVTLIIHMKDCYWENSIENEQYGDDGRSNIIEGSMMTGEVWDEVFTNPEITSFPNLTHLTLAWQARGAEHLARFAKYAPNLVNITVSSHFRGEYDMDQYDMIDGCNTFDRLVTLTVAGHGFFLVAVVAAMLPLSPKLHYLTAQISNLSESLEDYELPSIVPLGRAISIHKRLKGLALYGICVSEVTELLRQLQDREKGEGDLKLSTLVLEYEGIVIDDGQPFFPLLGDAPDARQALEVKRIIYIDKYWRSRAVTDETGSSWYYDKAKLAGLFNHYPTLQKVMWVSKYPTDPFLAMPNRIVKCSVKRADIEGGGEGV